MTSGVLPVLLALAAGGSAAALQPPRPPTPGFLSFPITHEVRTVPFRTIRRSASAPLWNVSSASYLISRRLPSPRTPQGAFGVDVV